MGQGSLKHLFEQYVDTVRVWEKMCVRVCPVFRPPQRRCVAHAETGNADKTIIEVMPHELAEVSGLLFFCSFLLTYQGSSLWNIIAEHWCSSGPLGGA